MGSGRVLCTGEQCRFLRTMNDWSVNIELARKSRDSFASLYAAPTSSIWTNSEELGAPVLSIGGAGTFDGIFVTGVIAVLLAGVTGRRTAR